ncbi:MAG: baseplate J/gp47 family protein [Desulfovibrio sp.]|nr:baseplate J/gp47 family protein [Desulfovibrio sp.]
MPSLAALPAISFAQGDAADVEAAVISAYERLAGVTLQRADPVRLFLESLAYVITVQNNVIDLAGKQNLLAFASGGHLDHLGALMGVSRIKAAPARCTLRFSVGEVLAFALPIPAGTRVSTQDGKISFGTELSVEIPAGELSVDVPARAAEAGLAASGLVAGQVCRLVDPLPHIVSAVNVTATAEGADVEDDARLRERIRLAPESYTVAGSAGQYEARVLEVSADILAVSVHTPEPGVVDVRFVLAGGELPDADMIALVRDHLNAETVRPLTDKVLVGAPDVVEYAIAGTWYLTRADSALLGPVAQAVARAVEEFRVWQRSAPGRDINPTRLVAMLHEAGAKRVELASPVFTELTGTQIARETTVEIAFGGLEEE